MNSSTSVIVSARECAASDSIADEWLISPPTSLAIAMPRFATPATTTVPVLSPPEPCSGLPTSPWAAGTGGPGVAAESSAVTRGWLMAPEGPAVETSNRPGSPHPDEVHHEDQRGARLDDPARAAVAVGLVRRDGEPAPAAHPHAGDALVPALDDHADTQPELQRVAAIPGGVELLAALVGDADVVGADQTACGGLRPVPDDEVLDHQVGRRGAGRRLDVGTGQLSHGISSGSGAGSFPTASGPSNPPGPHPGQPASRPPLSSVRDS